MKKLLSLFTFCLFFALGMIAMAFTAGAYIDPSAMTYIIQVVVGIIVVSGATLGFYFNKIKRKLHRNKDENEQPAETVEQTEEIDDNGEFDDFDNEAEE